MDEVQNPVQLKVESALPDKDALRLIAAMLKRQPEQDHVDEIVSRPFQRGDAGWRYRVKDGMVLATQTAGGQETGDPVQGSFREFLWTRLRLDEVLERYRKSYQDWERGYNGVSYVKTGIIDDESNKSLETDDFIDKIWKKKRSGLHLLMAEYGMGKSSFCQYLRHRADEKIDLAYYNASEEVSFPLFFNLNEFRDQDFDRFIESHLFRDYGVSLEFPVLQELCRAGFFCLVLDAWDQMHGTPADRQTLEDIRRFSSVWSDYGAVLITCRRSFYTRQLRLKSEEDVLRDASLYTLCGFGREAAESYFTRVRELSPDRLPPLEDWFDAAWAKNPELLARPLNLQLLSRHFDLIRQSCDLRREKLDAFRFFELVLSNWEAEWDHRLPPDTVLKTLVRETLRAGLNRSIPLEQFRNSLPGRTGGKEFAGLLDSLKALDFFSIQHGEGGDTVEFLLAAYQEFLWAKYVLKELEEKKLCDKSCLLNRYLLIPEVRVWIVMALSERKDKQQSVTLLKTQLILLAYKNREETGWSGGNALTLLADLARTRDPVFLAQFRELNLTDRPLQGADLHGLDLRGMKFNRSKLADANFSNTRLDGASFVYTELNGARWEEYEKLLKCAYLGDPGGGGSVVSAVKSGGVLSFCPGKADAPETIPFTDDIIQDFAADSAGVYTAGQDGRVGYLDKHGRLKNAYITGGGLQSITTGELGTVYVSAEQQGLFFFDWRSGRREEIRVQDEDGKPLRIESLEDIHYHRSQNVEYIAYLSDKGRGLVLLNLVDQSTAERQGGGKLGVPGLRITDICFAGDQLVYAVSGRGVYSVSLKNFFGDMSSASLLMDDKRRCAAEGPTELAWAAESETLFVLKTDGGSPGALLSMKLDGSAPIERPLSWYYDGTDYGALEEKTEGFCCSPDGRIVAMAGGRLSVFSWEEDRYELVREPLEARISCAEANFQGCEGLPGEIRERFDNRGAMV